MSTTATFNLETEWARYYRLPTEGKISDALRTTDEENRRRSDAIYPSYRHIPLLPIDLSDGSLQITQVSSTNNLVSGEIRYKGYCYFIEAGGLPRNVEGTIQFLTDHINIVIKS